MAKHRLRGPLAGLLTALTAAAVALAGCGTDSGGSSGGSGPIQIWEGYTGAEAKAFAHLVAEYQARLPDRKLLQAKLHEFYELAAGGAP